MQTYDSRFIPAWMRLTNTIKEYKAPPPGENKGRPRKEDNELKGKRRDSQTNNV
jgi:hypothetical protein